jgi:hypothetical protein
MKNPSKSATSLKELINHAIFDLEVTQAEYQEIMNMAQNDGIIDKEESALLSHFHEMISNGTVKRVS